MRSSSAGDLDRGQSLAQVHRHGLAQRQQFQRPVLDLLLQLIDTDIAAHHPLRRGRVPPGDGFDGGSELGLGKAAHLGHQRGQAIQLFAEGLHYVLGHWRPFRRLLIGALP